MREEMPPCLLTIPGTPYLISCNSGDTILNFLELGMVSPELPAEAQRRIPVGSFAHGKRKIRTNGMGVGRVAGAAICERPTVVAQTHRKRVACHILDRLLNKIREGRQRRELA